MKLLQSTNRNFGILMMLIFFFVAYSSYRDGKIIYFAISFFIGIVFLLAAVFFQNVLAPLNKLWVSLGYLLGSVVSPIVMAIIFFTLFTPMAFIMRVAGRDELNLKINKSKSHWVDRDGSNAQKESFKNQF